MKRAQSKRGAGRPVDTELRNGVLRVAVRRPRLDGQAAAGIVEACAVSEDERCRVVVFEASGPRFWAGLPPGGEEWDGPDFVSALASVTRPVVALLRGRIEDEGLELALAADLRVAGPGARFALVRSPAGRSLGLGRPSGSHV